MTDLTALLERITDARGGDQRLDGLIAKAFGIEHGRKEIVHYETRSVSIYNEIAPNFTSSIDAALGLVEKCLPRCQKSLTESPTIITTRGFSFSCDLYDTTGADGQHYGRFQGIGWEAEGAGNSFPLAILAALLRAKISEAG